MDGDGCGGSCDDGRDTDECNIIVNFMMIMIVILMMISILILVIMVMIIEIDYSECDDGNDDGETSNGVVLVMIVR